MLLLTGFKSGEFRGHSCKWINSRVSFCNNSMCNGHFKFHKVVYRHYSGEVENIYIILQQIYSGNGVPNFVSIAWVS